MWTLARGVELKSFKYFDDSVSTFQKNSIATIQDIVIRCSFESQKLYQTQKLTQLIVSGFDHEDFLYLASKNVSSVSIHTLSLLNMSVIQQRVEQTIIASSSAFYAYRPALSLIFGLRDGSILAFSVSELRFKFMVSQFFKITSSNLNRWKL
jgi:hypothetical protein